MSSQNRVKRRTNPFKNTETMARLEKPTKETKAGDEPNLEELLNGEQTEPKPATGEQAEPKPATSEQTEPKPAAGGQAEPKPAAKKSNGNVTFYTRVGAPFDPKTGKERPCQKHVVTRSWWLVNKNRLSRLGYNVIKVEGE